MDWDLAIKRNSEALKEIIAGLFAMLELAGGATVSRIPQSLHSAVRRVLCPAESAVRRLIVIAARGLVVKLASPRPVSRPKPVGSIRKGGGSRPSFQLFDTRKNFPELRQPRIKYAKHPPRILFFHEHSRVDDLWPSRPVAAPPPALRWPCQCRAPYPEASDPQVRTRGPAAPGQAICPLAGKARGHAKSEVQITAPAWPSSRLSPKAHSPGR